MNGPFLSRRALLAAAAALPFAGLAPGLAPASAIPPSGLLSFTVLRGRSPMGTHTIVFRPEGLRLTVEIAIDLAVKLGPIPLFRYTHRNTEVWEDGRLIALDTRTNDNGDPYEVTARAIDGGLRVDGVDGSFVAPPDIIPSSYWDMRIVRRNRILDTQRGIVRTISSERVGEEQVAAAGQTIMAERWRIADTLPVDLWYSRAGQFVKLAFKARGQSIDYLLREGAEALAPGY